MYSMKFVPMLMWIRAPANVEDHLQQFEPAQRKQERELGPIDTELLDEDETNAEVFSQAGLTPEDLPPTIRSSVKSQRKESATSTGSFAKDFRKAMIGGAKKDRRDPFFAGGH
jgi:hypothetical protein